MCTHSILLKQFHIISHTVPLQERNRLTAAAAAADKDKIKPKKRKSVSPARIIDEPWRRGPGGDGDGHDDHRGAGLTA